MYNDAAYISIDFASRELIELRRQIGPEEGARFNVQLGSEQRKILAVAKQTLML
jgi:hypothetical protein